LVILYVTYTAEQFNQAVCICLQLTPRSIELHGISDLDVLNNRNYPTNVMIMRTSDASLEHNFC